eukprot:5545539-Pleurochrysis_carterae.AAC.1
MASIHHFGSLALDDLAFLWVEVNWFSDRMKQLSDNSNEKDHPIRQLARSKTRKDMALAVQRFSWQPYHSFLDTLPCPVFSLHVKKGMQPA